MQNILLTLLAFFARHIISYHRPKIIWITGTVGKTTVTAHAYGYLSQVLPEQRIGYSPDHYNGEYGLPLTIIGAKTGWKNPFKWIWVFCVAFSRFFRPYPAYLVLEYGIDHPGEMDFLLSIAIPDIAIITEIAPNHLEQFGTFDRYKAEKFKLIESARELIIHDSLRDSVEREALYYGNGGMSEISVSQTIIDTTWSSAQVHFHRMDYDLTIHSFGEFHITNLLPLYGIAEIWGLPIDGIGTYASLAQSEPWRSSILQWIENSTIIDGSYNGGYLAIHAGIASLQSFASSHRLIFLLWDMRELGDTTEELHHAIAHEVLELFQHKQEDISFFLVWPHMRDFVFPILEKHFHTELFLSSRLAGNAIARFLTKKWNKPAMIYVKWSQNTIFLEEAVEILLADKKDRTKLCRQGKDWKKKKQLFFDSI